MVVAIFADVVEIVMFATGANALLTVHRTLQLRHRISLSDRAQEYGLKLVHSGIGEQKGRIVVGDYSRAGHDSMPSLLEVVEEGLADLRSRPLPLSSHDGCVQSCTLRVKAGRYRFARGKQELKHEVGKDLDRVAVSRDKSPAGSFSHRGATDSPFGLPGVYPVRGLSGRRKIPRIKRRGADSINCCNKG